MGFATVAGGNPKMKVPVAYPDNFADATWAQIIDACQKNKVPETWVVGSQKDMTINGIAYPIDIIGENHDTYSAGGTAPLTFQMHDCYGTAESMNNSDTNKGGWTSCVMRSTRLPTILTLMPSEVQSGIREVNKKTSAGNESSTINTTADKLFLLSEIEVFGSTTNAFSGEGTQYNYYKAGNSKVKKRNGSANSWWERSPNKDRTTKFCSVSLNGDADWDAAGDGFGVAFAWCF